MMAPRYRNVTAAQIPLLELRDGVKVRVVSGTVDGVPGPVREIRIDPEYLDVEVPPGAAFGRDIPADHAVFAYVFAGAAHFAPRGEGRARAGELVTFAAGDGVQAVAGAEGARFLLVAGRPLREPVAWRGPIVMNTEAELRRAFADYEAGTFLKHEARFD